MAWMMGALHSSQGELVRRQSKFQHALMDMVRQMRESQLDLMQAQIERMERIDEELATLRAELERQNERAKAEAARQAAEAKPTTGPNPSTARPAQPPKTAPAHKITAPQPAPGQRMPETDPIASTAWLLDRIHNLERENRSSWRDLINRAKTLGSGKKPEKDA